jgi:hypothetical protein
VDWNMNSFLLLAPRVGPRSKEQLKGSPLHKLALIFQCIGMLWGTPGMPKFSQKGLLISPLVWA